ncbi:transposase, partial [Thioclava arctica]|uniref:transposase n=1 Tax=Thioclava arctica TaxID=3238301 RepID=UPI003F61D8FE
LRLRHKKIDDLIPRALAIRPRCPVVLRVSALFDGVNQIVRYDADWFRDALIDKGIKHCIPGRKSRDKPVKYDKRRYKRRNRIEIMFGRLKDWRRISTRCNRCPKVFLSAIALAATVLFWL